MRHAVFALLLALTACTEQESNGAFIGGSGGVPPGSSSPGTKTPEDMDMSSDMSMSTTESIFTLLSGGTYEGWSAPNPLQQADPHGNARAFLNAPLVASLRAKEEVHPEGSMVVLERKNAQGDLFGWSVMMKAKEGKELKWFWFETNDLKDADKYLTAEFAEPTCVACHTAGPDLLRGNYQL